MHYIRVQALAMLDRRSHAADSVIEAVKRIEFDMRNQWIAAQVYSFVYMSVCIYIKYIHIYMST